MHRHDKYVVFTWCFSCKSNRSQGLKQEKKPGKLLCAWYQAEKIKPRNQFFGLSVRPWAVFHLVSQTVSTVMGLCGAFAEFDWEFVIIRMKTNDKRRLKTARSVATFLLVLSSSSSRTSSCACCSYDYTKIMKNHWGNLGCLSSLSRRRREQTQLHCGFKRDVSNWQLAPPQCFRRRLVEGSSPSRLFSLLAWDW